MSDETTLINIGELSKPLTVFIEKVSDAVGGVFKPYQIRRVAQAEVEAEKIKAISHIQITELQQRALHRFITEEARKQENIESITAKALPQIEENAEPQNMEDDWISNFFDKSRLISDDEMQLLWSKVLAGEANSPGTFSKRTVNFLGSLDKSDALLFQTLCSFSWDFRYVAPLIYDLDVQIFKNHGISFNSLKHLDEIGLISFNSLSGFQQTNLSKTITVYYYDTPINIEFENESNNSIPLGKVVLSKIGQELAPISGSSPISEFFDYILETWVENKGLRISSPINLNAPKGSDQ